MYFSAYDCTIKSTEITSVFVYFRENYQKPPLQVSRGFRKYPDNPSLTDHTVQEEAVRVINCTQGVEGGSYIKDHVKCWHSPPGIYIGLYDAHLIPLNAQPSFGGRTAAAAQLPYSRLERPRE